MNKKYYAVKKGKTTGIFEDWGECLKSVSGYSGAKYESFYSKEEAEAYIKGKDYYLDKINEEIKSGYTVIYTDGSYCEETKKYGYAMIIFYDDKQEEYYGSSNSKSFIESRNVAGEVMAVINAFNWCISHNRYKIKIYYDYEGIEKFISGEYEGKQDISKFFKKLYDEKYKNILQCDFEHVKAHTNNKYNEKADQLAKVAAKSGIKRKSKTGNGWFAVPGIESKDIIMVLDLFKDDNRTAEIKDIVDNNTEIAKEIKLDKSKLIVKLYKGENKTLLIQGNEKTSLFQLIISYLFELLNIDKVESMMSDAYQISISKKEIDEKYSILFNNIPKDIPISLTKLLKQALINLQLDINECYDYSFLLIPAYRAIDGLMKYIFEKNNIHIKRTGRYNQFDTDPITGKKICLEESINLADKERLEKCYNFYYNHRHDQSHFGEIEHDTTHDDTMVIDKIEEARDLLREALNIISENIA